MPTTFYTQEEYHRATGHIGAYVDFIRRIGQYFRYKVQKDNSSNEDHDKYPYIDMSPHVVMRQLHLVKDHIKANNKGGHFSGELKFVDAGCGIGFIRHMAYSLGFQAYGIEYCKELVDLSNIILSYPPVIHGDILQQDYSKYDVVYYYHPFRDRAKQAEFEKKVESELKIGGYIIANMKNDFSWKKNPQFELVSNNDGIILRKIDPTAKKKTVKKVKELKSSC